MWSFHHTSLRCDLKTCHHTEVKVAQSFIREEFLTAGLVHHLFAASSSSCARSSFIVLTSADFTVSILFSRHTQTLCCCNNGRLFQKVLCLSLAFIKRCISTRGKTRSSGMLRIRTDEINLVPPPGFCLRVTHTQIRTVYGSLLPSGPLVWLVNVAPLL